jgi:hypothetical protein
MMAPSAMRAPTPAEGAAETGGEAVEQLGWVDPGDRRDDAGRDKQRDEWVELGENDQRDDQRDPDRRSDDDLCRSHGCADSFGLRGGAPVTRTKIIRYGVYGYTI